MQYILLAEQVQEADALAKGGDNELPSVGALHKVYNLLGAMMRKIVPQRGMSRLTLERMTTWMLARTTWIPRVWVSSSRPSAVVKLPSSSNASAKSSWPSGTLEAQDERTSVNAK